MSREEAYLPLIYLTGGIYKCVFTDPLSPFSRTLEYRVQQNIEDTEGLNWASLGDRISPNFHRYQPFTPGVEFYKDLYRRVETLRLLPLIEPRDDADRDMAWDELPDDWRKDLLRRKQERLAELYEKHGWPDRAKFDRGHLIADWEVAKDEFDKEEMRLSDQYESAQRALDRSAWEGPEDDDESLSASDIYRDGDSGSDAAEEHAEDEEAEPNEPDEDGSATVAIRKKE